MKEQFKAKFKEWFNDFCKFMVFDLITSALIALLVIHFVV